MHGEAELIARIARRIPCRTRLRDSWLRFGIGDDAALLRLPHLVAVSCDPFLEGSHFLTGVHPPEAVGFKALARAVSDLAAMGATPRGFLLGLSIPANRTGKWLDAFLAGMARVARRYRILLVGGDVSRHASVLVHLTVIGEVMSGRALTRSGAQPGDAIFLSGRPGSAQLGLEIVLRRLHRRPSFQPLLQPHLYPEARVALGQWLARHRFASAAIDTSDGLSTDLARLCAASRAGARIQIERLPLPAVPPTLLKKGLDPQKLALHGGEDYELLFTVPPSVRGKLPRVWEGNRLTEIGVVTRGRGLWLESATGIQRFQPRGWDHFARR